MKASALLLAAASAGLALAQRPMDMSICDYYTTALLTNNTAENQATVLTLIVNTVVIGNYTPELNKGVTVPGILANGTVNGTAVSLLKYFDGTVLSTNRGGKPVAINFLDDGGAAPLLLNKPANGTTSNQYRLITHLYQFFGTLLGCSQQGMPGFDSYSGDPGMYRVHKFMDLDLAETTYFITQVGLAAASFGVATADVQLVGKTLFDVFGYRCTPEVMLIPNTTAALQDICVASDCPVVATNAVCGLYDISGNGTEPLTATATMTGTATMSKTGAATGSVTGAMSTAGASLVGVASGGGIVAMLLGLAALL